MYCCSGGFYESLAVYRTTRRAGCRLRTAAFESFESLFLLRLIGRVGAIPT